ncbi:CLUMA_CG020901, isoform A [Clunio marinus]|uniref:CLUMA_CG020901, isoform A n=1 Tax=Clunio marinus TaxID=568069 RepID=A0A1J1JAM4_9DIPT|nr:CLUMA_CG020901, isoform A [Clunio marinus]
MKLPDDKCRLLSKFYLLANAHIMSNLPSPSKQLTEPSTLHFWKIKHNQMISLGTKSKEHVTKIIMKTNNYEISFKKLDAKKLVELFTCLESAQHALDTYLYKKDQQ